MWFDPAFEAQMKRLLSLVVLLWLSSLAVAQQLPHTVVPDRYELKFTPDMQAARFGGEELIEVRVLRPTASVVLNALEITFQDVTITAKGKTQKAKVTPDKQNEMATLTVASPIPAGPAQIRIRYTGVLNDRLRGFYLAKAQGHRYAVTQFEATDARRAFPSFDEPAYKAVFDVSVVAPKADTAISNGRMISDQPGPGANQHTMRFATSPKMSTYLVALLVGEFDCIQGGADGVPMRVCTPPGKQEMGRFALSASENVLKFYNRYFGIKYPFGKLDHIAIPDFEAGAMENIGAITYRDVALLTDEKHASVAELQEIAETVAHEMAHQWFGDLVTMQWWNDIWLNEGFATWMTFKPIEAWKPEWRVELEEQTSANRAMATDSLKNTRPIRQQAQTSAQINELFDAIAYNKTGAVLRMLESYVGSETFRQGVNNYLQAHAYSNATAQDFWNAIAAVSHKPADKIMASFVSNPGLPVISADFRCTGQPSVTLRQQRFFVDPSADKANQIWNVPVCFSEQSGQHCELLTQREQTFSLDHCSPAAYLNAGGRGYYRSEYSPEAIRGLAPQAESTLSPVERLALLENEWALVRNGSHSIGLFMDLANGLKSDRTEAVIGELGGRLHAISDDLLTPSDRERYQAWVRDLLRPAIQELGWTAAPDDSAERRQLRAAVFYTLGYSGQDPEAFAQAKSLTEKYMQDAGSVDASLLGTVFQLSAMQGTPALYDEFLNGARNAKVPEVYYRYLSALTQFRDPALLQRTLDYAISPAVRTQDSIHLVAAVMANPAADDLAWQFVQKHWSELQRKSGSLSASGIVRATGAFCSPDKQQEVRQFFTEHPVPGAQRSLKLALEQIGSCVQLKQAQEPNLAKWLQGQKTAAGKLLVLLCWKGELATDMHGFLRIQGLD
jgi:aminopeptidase N/puromycin-sensitive aminopeptidase